MARNTTGADYCPNVPPVLPDTKLPFEFFPDGVPVTIVDTSSRLERVIQTINTLGKEPFNAEPPRSALVSSYVTPVDLFYKRNHGPIPIVDDLNSYFVTLTGLLDNPAKLFMEDIRSLPKFNVTATLQCAGNRRTAMSKVRNVRGVGWDVSAIGNGSSTFYTEV